jgi:hypothetical protein
MGNEQVLPIPEMEIWDRRPRVLTAECGGLAATTSCQMCERVQHGIETAFQKPRLASLRLLISRIHRHPFQIEYDGNVWIRVDWCLRSTFLPCLLRSSSFLVSNRGSFRKIQDIYHEDTRDKIRSPGRRIETNQVKIHSINLSCITNVHITTHLPMVSSISVPIH